MKDVLDAGMPGRSQSSLPRRRRRCHLAAVVIAVAAVAAETPGARDAGSWFAAELPERAQERGYVSSDACRRCHPDEHAAWLRSNHRSMGMPATPENVRGDFGGVELQSRGRSYRVERRGDEFWVRMPDPDADVRNMRAEIHPDTLPPPNPVWKRIAMATGAHWMQTYWVPLDGDRGLYQFPWCYMLDTKTWVPREDSGFLLPPTWTKGRTYALWNSACIRCHSTGGQPGIDFADLTFKTKVADFGIACEACHGPGAKHVEANRSVLKRLSRSLRSGPDETIVNPARLDAARASMVCGQCHSFWNYRSEKDWWLHGDDFHPGDDLSLTRLLAPIKPQWKDGFPRSAGVQELASVRASKCASKGELSCMYCHNEHKSEPVHMLGAGMDGDVACAGCHPGKAKEGTTHTHHAAGSEGNRCQNCHMPRTTYSLFHCARSHRIDSPSVAQTSRSGRPNACNLCHLDKTLAWTGERLKEWYSQPQEDLGEDEQRVAAGALWMLRGDPFERIVAAWHTSYEPARTASGQDWLVPYLAHLLDDAYPDVRRVAYLSLRTLPGYADFVFDPLGPDEERGAAQERALAAWLPGTRTAFSEAVLLGPDGSLRCDVFYRLVAEGTKPLPPAPGLPGWRFPSLEKGRF